MSRSDDTTEDHRRQLSHDHRSALSVLRRMVVGVTKGVFWQVIGGVLLDGTRETAQVESFPGVGFYARPRSTRNVEAIVGYVSSAENPAIIATRDEKLRSEVASNLAVDETASFNSSTIVHHKANGTVEIHHPGGAVQPTLLGQTYRTAEDNMLTQISTALTAISGITGITGPQAAAVNAAVAAIATFKAAASTYLTTVAKLQ